MKYLLVLLLALAGCGYDGGLSNEAIIAQTKQCESAGMRAVAIKDNINMRYIVRIQCEPKRAAP